MSFFSDAWDKVKGFGKDVLGYLDGSDLASGISPFGSVVSSASSALGLFNSLTGSGIHDQKDLMKFQAALQDSYWRSQYGSRHQLEVSDLKKAGLNPILSANSAGGVAGVSANAAPNETRSQKLAASAALQHAWNQNQLLKSQYWLNAKQQDMFSSVESKNRADVNNSYSYLRLAQNESAARVRNLDAMTANLKDPFLRYGPLVLGGLNAASGFVGHGLNAAKFLDWKRNRPSPPPLMTGRKYFDSEGTMRGGYVNTYE